jgi:hypothetical protein
MKLIGLKRLMFHLIDLEITNFQLKNKEIILIIYMHPNIVWQLLG